MVSSTNLPFQDEFDTFTTAQLWVLVVGCAGSFLGAVLVAFAVSAQQGVVFAKSILRTLSITGILWSAATFMATSHALFLRYTGEESSPSTDVFLAIVSLFHEWVEWTSWVLSSVLAYALVNPKLMVQGWSNPRTRYVTYAISWGIPLCLLVPTGVLSSVRGSVKANGVVITPLVHGLLLLCVVICDLICFSIVSYRLKKSYSSVARFMSDRDRAASMKKLWRRDFRMMSFLVPFVICWTVPTYISFAEAQDADEDDDAEKNQAVAWLFVLLTPYYWFFSFLVFAHGRYRKVAISFIEAVPIARIRALADVLRARWGVSSLSSPSFNASSANVSAVELKEPLMKDPQSA
jgi:hypothetical protein